MQVIENVFEFHSIKNGMSDQKVLSSFAASAALREILPAEPQRTQSEETIAVFFAIIGTFVENNN